MTRDDLLQALQDHNCLAFLRLIRAGETGEGDDAYTEVFGGGHFAAPPWVHPQQAVVLKGLKSTAAGAYQFLAGTWEGLAGEYGFADFSPPNQDLGAVALVARRGALDDVLAGRIPEAVAKCNKEWASLPGSPYGQPTRTLDQALGAYLQFGGVLAGGPPDPPAEMPAEEPAEPEAAQPTIEVNNMGVLAALLPTILQSLPQLISVFSSPTDSDVAKRNQAAGVLVADTLVKATSAVNLQDAVDKIQNDPKALAAAHAAVNDLLPQIVESGDGGIGAARKASADPAQLPFYKQPAFWFLLMSIPLVYMLAASVLFGVGGASWSDDAKMMVATGILAVLAGGSAFFWGSSMGSQRKDAQAARNVS